MSTKNYKYDEIYNIAKYYGYDDARCRLLLRIVNSSDFTSSNVHIDCLDTIDIKIVTELCGDIRNYLGNGKFTVNVRTSEMKPYPGCSIEIHPITLMRLWVCQNHHKSKITREELIKIFVTGNRSKAAEHSLHQYKYMSTWDKIKNRKSIRRLRAFEKRVGAETYLLAPYAIIKAVCYDVDFELSWVNDLLSAFHKDGLLDYNQWQNLLGGFSNYLRSR